MTSSSIHPMTISYEPGDLLPSRLLLAHMRALHSQSLVVHVHRWTMENDVWLRDCALTVVFDEMAVQPEKCTLSWNKKPTRRTSGYATRSLYRLAVLLDNVSDRESEALPELSRKIIVRMNAVGWAPDQAVATLSPLAPFIPRDEAEAWLTRHMVHWQATYLAKHTAPLTRARSASPARL